MTIQGNLREMSLASLISINCNEMNQACLRLRRGEQEGMIFLTAGNIMHAVLDSQSGEEVIYEMLTWEEGEFELEMNVTTPERTITSSWSSLLLEGMRRIDEDTVAWEGLEEILEGKEVSLMARKTEETPLSHLLEEMAGEMPGFLAASVVGMDGLSIADYSTTNFDNETAAAQFALVMKLVQKSAAQIGSDNVEDNLVTSKDRYILTRSLGDGTYFLTTAVDRDVSSLGNVRLVTRMFSLGLWDAIPRRE